MHNIDDLFKQYQTLSNQMQALEDELYPMIHKEFDRILESDGINAAGKFTSKIPCSTMRCLKTRQIRLIREKMK